MIKYENKLISNDEWKLIEIIRSLEPYDEVKLAVNQNGKQLTVLIDKKERLVFDIN